MKWNKWWTAGLILIAAAGAGSYFLWSSPNEKPLQAAWQTTQVRKGSLESKISGTGNIQAADRQTLTAQTTGTIASVMVKEGDKVKKGQVLATFEEEDQSSIQSQIRSKELDLQKKRLDLEHLQTQFKEAMDDQSREELRVSIEKQQLDIETVQEDIADLREDLDEALEPITAPIDGTLATFNIREGDTIGGQGGNSEPSLGEVVDYDHLQMVVGVDELDINKVKLDQQATILVEALPDQTFTGKVTEIAQEGTASNGVATFDVTISIDETGDLKAGMSAEASIIVERKADALYLPIEAVQSAGERYLVMVPDSKPEDGEGDGDAKQGQAPQGQPRQREAAQSPQGTSGDRAASGNAGNRHMRQMAAFAQSGVRMVTVEVGIHNEDFIEIVSGLNEGDEVVLPQAVASSGSNNQMPGGVMTFPGGGIGAGPAIRTGPGGGGGFSGDGNENMRIRPGQGG